MYRRADLKRLAETYIEATGRTANWLSNEISGQSNNRLIGRLLDNLGIGGPSIEAASDFFDREWPAHVPWPVDVARSGAKQDEAAE